MGNCLVTKLKGTVDNDNLPILGRLRLLINLSNGGTFKFTENAEVKLLDGTFKDTGLKTATVLAQQVWYPNGTNINPDAEGQQFVTVEVPKYTPYSYGNCLPYPLGNTDYDFISLSLVNPDSMVDAVLQLTDMFNQDQNKYTIIGLDDFDFSKARYISIKGYNLNVHHPIDITSAGLQGSSLTYFGMSYTDGEGKIIGSFDNLGKTTLSSLSFPDAKSASIDLLNFVNNRRALGDQYQTGSVTLVRLHAITVKYNGNVITVPESLSQTLEWTADSITLNGEPLS